MIERKKRTFALVALLIATSAVLAGCSVVDTAPDQVALHYNGGNGESQTYTACVPPSTNQWNSPNDTYYYYPAGQRTYEFSDRDGADFKPLVANSKDSQQLTLSVAVTFTLDTSCVDLKDPTGKDWPGGKLQKFHEMIANKYSAAPTDYGKGMGDGWQKLLDQYLQTPLTQVVQTAVQQYGWSEAYNDPTIKTSIEQQVQKNLPIAIKQMMGDDYFLIGSVLVQKPEVSPALQQGLEQQQAQQLQAQAAKAASGVGTDFPGGVAAYDQHQLIQAEIGAVNGGRVPVILPPQGAGINVTAPTK